MRVLADRDPAPRRLLRHTLEVTRHSVIEAEAGGQAMLDVSAHRPDVVILDDALGEGLTGIETAVLLRSVGYTGPIILFSPSLVLGLTAYRLPLDVWPVARTDDGTLLPLISGAANLVA